VIFRAGMSRANLENPRHSHLNAATASLMVHGPADALGFVAPTRHPSAGKLLRLLRRWHVSGTLAMAMGERPQPPSAGAASLSRGIASIATSGQRRDFRPVVLGTGD
jgi:hypothetical protein